MKTETISQYLQDLAPGNEMRLGYSESNRVLVHRAAARIGLRITTEKDGNEIVVRHKEERMSETASRMGIRVSPITDNGSASVEVGQDDGTGRFILWATKTREPVPEEVLRTLDKDALSDRIKRGLFIKVFKHELLNDGRDDSKYLA